MRITEVVWQQEHELDYIIKSIDEMVTEKASQKDEGEQQARAVISKGNREANVETEIEDMRRYKSIQWKVIIEQNSGWKGNRQKKQEQMRRELKWWDGE